LVEYFGAIPNRETLNQKGKLLNRPGWAKYFMSFARLASSRSTCLHRQVGAVAVKNNQIIATGYNGAATKQRHCLELGCLRDNIPSGTQHELWPV